MTVSTRFAGWLLCLGAFATFAVLGWTATSTATAAGPLAVGFADELFESGEAATREPLLEQAVESGASIVRINVLWSQIAPKQVPEGFEPSNPASPGYDWTDLDGAVRGASARGLRIMFTVYSAPGWAEGENRPRRLHVGAWRPEANEYGAFAEALASRYSGHFSDSSGARLPRVEDFEAWNEPNLNLYLAPQWEGETEVGADLYRQLVNSFYVGVKSVQPRATVIAGSLAPFGDPPGGERTPPVTFLRTLLCLEGGALKLVPCPDPAHFDVLSDHPIAVGAPDESAASPLDVTTPNLDRLTRILTKAEASKRVLPRERRPLWVTEFWYDTNPPDPQGLSLSTQARYYEQDLYSFWQQGASVAITLQLRDAPEGPSYATTNQSGIYFLDGSPKPSRTALRFPFVAHREGSFKVGVWGIAPRRGKVLVQALRSGHWKTLMTVHAGGREQPFTADLSLYRFAKLRALSGGEASLTRSQR